MKLSDLKTEDGDSLYKNKPAYILESNGCGVFTCWLVEVSRVEHHGVFVWSEQRQKSSWVPIVNGVAKGLWAFRDSMLTGLGRGATT